MAFFQDLLKRLGKPLSHLKIVDIGGSVEFWENNFPELFQCAELAVVNLAATSGEAIRGNMRYVSGDARDLRGIRDWEYDVAFSNSVIEHVGTLYDQRRMASEIARIARAYFVQTPNRRFPIEPHFLFPFWQYLPAAVRSRVLRHVAVGWHPRQPTLFSAKAEVEQIRLLSKYEIQCLFPGAEILEEKMGPFTKSFMAVKC